MSHYQANAYKQTRVKTAGQGQIIIMLYDEAVRQIDIAVELLREKTRELDRVNNAILKARDIITELMVSLDMEQGGEFASQIFSIYQWFNEQLMEGNIKKELDPLVNVRNMMTEIRAAWNEIVGKTTVREKDNVRGVNLAG